MNYNYGYVNQGNVVWVQGLEGARSYLIAPNTSVILLDSERKVFYIKSADISGMPVLKAYDYAEQMEQKPNYVTREELEEMLRGLTDAEQHA